MNPLGPLKMLLASALAAVAATAIAGTQDATPRPITQAEREHWAYRPLAPAQVPTCETSTGATNPIDAFLADARHRASIETLPRAGKATLARRVFFDLIGLPPTVDQLHEFLNDDSADAYQKLVDRLLASPAYGERWAQHWLDLARYAETDGFEHDLVRPHAWRYRDWVIEALNADMPFEQFLQWQVAGDELRPGDPQAAVATGFLLCGPDMPDLNLQEERRHVVLNEITATVGSVFLAMQFGCAQCHDHKYDPIRQLDFYRLRAFFEPTNIFRDHPIPTPEQLAERRRAEAAVPPEYKIREKRRHELEELGRARFREQNPDVRPSMQQALAELSETERNEHDELARQLRDAPRLPELPLGRVVLDGEPRASFLYLRGDFRQPGAPVELGTPEVLRSADDNQAMPAGPPRAALAQWLLAQPLTARVIVNRLWQWHFGVALAPMSSDFGAMGAAPTHPELLDWLAARLAQERGSLKQIHRLLVTSEIYRAASRATDPSWSPHWSAKAEIVWRQASAVDPQNQLQWRRRRLRLEGEAIRDAMLSASGRLSARRGGPGIRPPLPTEITATLLKDQWQVTPDEEGHRRRSIYLFVRRNLRYPIFDVFDRPDTNTSCAVRHESTTATQSLVLLNSPFSLQCAQWLAGALLQAAPNDPRQQIEHVYLRVLSRPASEDELHEGMDFLTRQSQSLRSSGRAPNDLALPLGVVDVGSPATAAALVDFCLALFNSNEFVYVD